MQLRKLFISSLPFFLLPCFNTALAQNGICKNDTTGLLFYSVENVSEVSSSRIGEKAAGNDGEKKVTAGRANTSTQKNNYYLIPFILSKITEHTCYKNPVLLKEKRSDVKVPYKYLRISINSFNNNLEYQFHLQKIDKDTEILKSSSFFINPDNPEYLDIISTEVQRIFECYGGTNKPPTAKIRVEGGAIPISKIIYKSNRDTIALDGSSSEDAETPKKYLIYKWKVNKGNEPAFLPDFKFENSWQKLVISEPGIYNFSLEVSDGVTTSRKDSVQISIYILQKPVLELTRNYFEIISQRNLFSKKEKRIYSLVSTVGFKVSNMEEGTRLFFKHVCSSNKSGKLFLNNRKGNADTGSFIIQGLSHVKFDTILKNKQDSIVFCLKNGIVPGQHKYVIYTGFDRVKSNYDTITVAYREKSPVSVTAGYNRFQVSQGENYFKGYNLDILKLGLRGYITQKFYVDMNFGVAANASSIAGAKNQDININTLMGQINYDIVPWKFSKVNERETPVFVSIFAAYYQVVLTDPGGARMIPQYGGGGKFRVQLFAKKPAMGVIFLELEAGGYHQLVNNPYKTGFGGINLIYGWWNY